MACQYKRLFRTHFHWHWPMNMIKVLWYRFQQCLVTCTILLVEGSSETSIFKPLSNTFSESLISELQKLWGSCFFHKCSKFNLDFKNSDEISENIFCFWDNCIWIGIFKLSLLSTGYISSVANVLTSSPKIWRGNKRKFFEHNFLASDKSILSRCCNPDFNSFWARLPYWLSKNPLKPDFLDIYLTTFSCIIKLSLLKTRYFSLAANVLTSSVKIWRLNKRGFYEHNFVASDEWIWWRCCDANFNSVWARLPYCLSKHPLKQEILDIYLTTFSASVISKIQNLSGYYFHSKCLKFNQDFKNAPKNWEKDFCFSHNCIWIGINKLSLGRRRYFSSPASILTSSPKILHVNKRDFFQVNWLGSDWWIS